MKLISRIFSLLLLLVTGVATAAEVTVYYHTDALGSPLAMTNSAGKLVWSESYTPYGQKQRNETSANKERVGYTGHAVGGAGNLVYMGARQYDPSIGRFFSVDPVSFVEANPMSFNRYIYANNNPYRYVDPDGNAIETPWDALNVGMGVVSFAGNVAIGNYGGAAVDLIGLVWDGTSTVLPGVPGGAATAIKGYRVKSLVVNGVEQVAKKVDSSGLGPAGESVSATLTGLPKNTTRIPSASGKKAYRVPDHMSGDQRYIAETKNVNSQSLRSQLLDDKSHVLRGGGPGRVDVIIDNRTNINTPLLREHLNPGSPIKLRSANLNGD